MGSDQVIRKLDLHLHMPLVIGIIFVLQLSTIPELLHVITKLQSQL